MAPQISLRQSLTYYPTHRGAYLCRLISSLGSDKNKASEQSSRRHLSSCQETSFPLRSQSRKRLHICNLTPSLTSIPAVVLSTDSLPHVFRSKRGVFGLRGLFIPRFQVITWGFWSPRTVYPTFSGQSVGFLVSVDGLSHVFRSKRGIMGPAPMQNQRGQLIKSESASRGNGGAVSRFLFLNLPFIFATYPLTSGGQPSSVSIFGLAGPGSVPAARRRDHVVGSYPTFSPLPIVVH